MRPKAAKSPMWRLCDEAHALEELLAHTQPPASQIDWYWNLSANLMTLVDDIEAYMRDNAQAAAADLRYLELRRRLVVIAGEIVTLDKE